MAALLLACLLYAQVARTADAPAVVLRTSLIPTSVTIGETARLDVYVLTDTFFTAAPELPPLSIPGVVAKLSDARAEHINEQIDGTTLFGLRHTYELTPLAAATFEIPAFPVVAHPGPGTNTVTAMTRALRLEASAPPGAEGAFVTRDLAISQQVDADLAHLKVGDAFSRTIEIVATGTPAMFIPDIETAEIDGLADYPQEPTIHDSAPGEPVVGKRTLVVRYVVQKPGDYELPALSIDWWSPVTKQKETATVPALKVHAIDAPPSPTAFEIPQEAAQPSAPLSRINWHWIGLVAAALAVGAALCWWLMPPAIGALHALSSRRAARHARYLDSEAHAFSQFQHALRARDSREITAALYRWLDRLPLGASTAQTAAATRDPQFIAACAPILAQPYHVPVRDEAIPSLLHSATELRHRLLGKPSTAPHRRTLARLNP